MLCCLFLCHHSVALCSYTPECDPVDSNSCLSLFKFPALSFEATNLAQLCCFRGIARFLSNTHVHAASNKQ